MQSCDRDKIFFFRSVVQRMTVAQIPKCARQEEGGGSFPDRAFPLQVTEAPLEA